MQETTHPPMHAWQKWIAVIWAIPLYHHQNSFPSLNIHCSHLTSITSSPTQKCFLHCPFCFYHYNFKHSITLFTLLYHHNIFPILEDTPKLWQPDFKKNINKDNSSAFQVIYLFRYNEKNKSLTSCIPLKMFLACILTVCLTFLLSLTLVNCDCLLLWPILMLV